MGHAGNLTIVGKDGVIRIVGRDGVIYLKNGLIFIPNMDDEERLDKFSEICNLMRQLGFDEIEVHESQPAKPGEKGPTVINLDEGFEEVKVRDE